MLPRSQRIFTVLSIFCSFILAEHQYFTPCNGKSELGGVCDTNTDCELKGSICLRGKCRCHPHYMEAYDEKGRNARCKSLPSKIGAACTTKCREPLFCRNGECQCVQRGTTRVQSGECITTSRVGDRCSRHYDCTAPFSACLNSTCVCISGTVQQGSRCVAAANCPLGGLPGQTCVRRIAQSMVHNLPRDQDNCPSGQVCVTPSDSVIGHCCPVTCPLASHVDAAFSCDPSTPVSERCPTDTHYCHMLSDGGFSYSVCCRRPCNSMAPNALYANNQCIPRGQLNSACFTDAQCGGAEGMQCVKESTAEGLVIAVAGAEHTATSRIRSARQAIVPRPPSVRGFRFRSDGRTQRGPRGPGGALNGRQPRQQRQQRQQRVFSPRTDTTGSAGRMRKKRTIGQCQCLEGFHPTVDSLTNAMKNPSQTCSRDCTSEDMSRDTVCMKSVELAGQCFIQQQCPNNSGCYRGRCLCRCGYAFKSGRCEQLPPPPTTTSQPSINIVPGLEVPKGNELLKIFGQIFGGGSQANGGIQSFLQG